MPRGRPRKAPANLPAHIARDYDKVPRGIYWSTTGAGRWYVLETQPDGSTKKKTVAQAAARLSDLHAIIDARTAGASVRGTVDYVGEQFAESKQYRELAPGTRRDYKICAAIVRKRPLGQLLVDKLEPHHIQKLIDAIADGRPESKPGAGDGERGKPAKANHVLRYLRRLFSWGIQRGHCKTNPARGVSQATELGLAKVPAQDVFARVLAFARERGARKAHTKGSCPPYLAPAMELAYGVRLRGIEVTTLTDAHELPEGIRSNRRKGSLDNITQWTPRLRAAWDEAVAIRKRANTTREGREKRPTPLRPEDRFLFVDQSGVALTKGAMDKAWQALMRLAIKAEVITAEQRFTLHGLKHRGVTDSAGNLADKQTAAGHKDQRMTHRYNHEVPVVRAAGEPAVEHKQGGEFSPEFSPSKEKGT